MMILENFQSKWTQLRLKFFQASLRHDLEKSAAAEQAQLNDQHIDQIWRRISAEVGLPTSKLTESGRSWKKNLTWAMPTLAMVAVTSVLYINTKTPLDSTLGIKSTQANELQLPTPSLQFALVKGKDDVSRGIKGMSIVMGSSIIFSVESEQLPKVGAVVSVFVKSPNGKVQKLVDHYTIQRGSNVIEGKQGLVAFSPDQLGTYSFYLDKKAKATDGKDIVFTGDANDGRFEITVVE